MKKPDIRKMVKLYAVTDRSWTERMSLYDQVEAALKGGITCLQLREKNLRRDLIKKEAKDLMKLAHKYNVPFILDNDVELAKEIDADGVHVGQTDMGIEEVRRIMGPDKIVGVSAQTLPEARIAEKGGADYLGVGTVFKSPTKPSAILITLADLEEITAGVNIPCLVIGGITPENVKTFKGTGIAGIAAISSIFGQPDPEKACQNFNKSLKELGLE